MGMFTELNCAFRLEKETPQEIIAILLFMAGMTDVEPSLPSHPLFATERWSHVLTGTRLDTYTFGDVHSTVRLDEFDEKYHVTIRSNLKNYQGELEKFLDWITPYMDAMYGDFIGYSRYEETEVPTLLYYPNRSFLPHVPEEITDWQCSDAVIIEHNPEQIEHQAELPASEEEKAQPSTRLYPHQQKSIGEFRRKGQQIVHVEHGAGKTTEITAESYVEQYRKQDGKPDRVINLEFCKVEDSWRVYEHVEGHAKNWEVTVGRKWKTDTEAKEFLKQQGWNPL
jgi:hypothetical protein